MSPVEPFPGQPSASCLCSPAALLAFGSRSLEQSPWARGWDASVRRDPLLNGSRKEAGESRRRETPLRVWLQLLEVICGGAGIPLPWKIPASV